MPIQLRYIRNAMATPKSSRPNPSRVLQASPRQPVQENEKHRAYWHELTTCCLTYVRMLEWDWSARITCCFSTMYLGMMGRYTHLHCMTCHSYLTTFPKSIWELPCTQLILLYVVRSSHCQFLSLWYKSCLDYRIFLRARINNLLWSQGEKMWSVVVQDACHTHDKEHVEDNHVKKNQGPYESILD